MLDALGHDEDAAWAVFAVNVDAQTVRLTVHVSADGAVISASGEGEVALLLPAFAFDGETYPGIAVDERMLTVTYDGWQCRTVTDGVLTDSGRMSRNRSGHYRVFRAVGQGSVTAKIAIVTQ
jgi:hypothetical protein